MKHTDRDPLPDTPRNIRLDAGMKLRQVAELMGCGTQVISRIERCHANPTAETMARFYAATGRRDLMYPLLHVLSDQAQDRVLTTYELWVARFRPDRRSPSM